HRRHREGQVDKRDEELLARKIELRDRPGGGDAEDEIEWNRDGGREQGKAYGGERVGIDEGGQVRFPALAQRLDEYGNEREQQEQREEAEGDAEHQALDPRRLARGGALLEPRRGVCATLEGNDGAGHQRSPPLRRA